MLGVGVDYRSISVQKHDFKDIFMVLFIAVYIVLMENDISYMILHLKNPRSCRKGNFDLLKAILVWELGQKQWILKILSEQSD